MKKPQKLSEIYWIFGIVSVSLGVALCSKSDLGVSMIAAPAFVLQEALSPTFPWLTVGISEYLFQGLLLFVLCLTVQRIRFKYLFAFVVAFLYGNVLDLWLLILGRDPFSALWMRWLFLIVGDLVTALGVACFFRTYLPLQVYELFVAEVADRYHKKVEKTKLVYDICNLFLSVLLAFLINLDADTFDWSTIYRSSYHYLGLGTLLTTILNTPAITLYGRFLRKMTGEDPLFPKLKIFFQK